MTRLVRFSNNAVSQLAANLTLSGTSLSVTPGDGAKFPSLSAGQYFMATLVKADGSTEVVKVTARSTDTLTIVRAAEPVAGASTSYSFSAGDRIEARLTAGVLGNELDRLDNGAVVEAVNKSANYTLTADDVTKLVRVTTTSGTTTITLPDTSALADDYDVIVAKVTSDANTVVIARTGSTDLINGATSYTIYNQWQSAWLIADRSTNTWTVISSGISAVNTVVDAGTGSGSATITLSGDPGSKNNTALFIGGVYQQKSTYSISGTTLTAGGTIASGVGYEVVWSAPLTVGTPSDGTVTPAKMSTGAPFWNASGNVGIGTATPSSFTGYTVVSVNNATNGGIYNILVNGTETARLQGYSGIFNVAAKGASTALAFETNGAERARINPAGSWLVGTTGSGGSYKVEVYSTNLATTMNGMLITNGANSTGGYFHAFQNYVGTIIGSISQATSTTVSYATSSDYRLKDNIAPMTGALATVAQLKPCTYTWKLDNSAGQGFIAHELAEVCPEAVVGEKDAVDADGNPKYQGIDTSFLVATLTAAIQEQQVIIEQLRADMDLLKNAAN